MNLEEERDALRRELIGTQQMLAAVLYTIGEPVAVTKDSLTRLPVGASISVEDDIARDLFVFSLVEAE